MEKVIITSAVLTVVRMCGNEDTYVLIVRGVQLGTDILVLTEIKSVYNLRASNGHKTVKNP